VTERYINVINGSADWQKHAETVGPGAGIETGKETCRQIIHRNRQKPVSDAAGGDNLAAAAAAWACGV